MHDPGPVSRGERVGELPPVMQRALQRDAAGQGSRSARLVPSTNSSDESIAKASTS
jgi:hypothetical protein